MEKVKSLEKDFVVSNTNPTLPYAGLKLKGPLTVRIEERDQLWVCKASLPSGFNFMGWGLTVDAALESLFADIIGIWEHLVVNWDKRNKPKKHLVDLKKELHALLQEA